MVICSVKKKILRQCITIFLRDISYLANAQTAKEEEKRKKKEETWKRFFLRINVIAWEESWWTLALI